jgi:tellurite resistance protein TehA-like permease
MSRPVLDRDVLARAQAGVRDLHPGYFALVMATGIISVAVDAAGAGWLSVLLLAVTIAAFLVLAAAYGWRLIRYRGEVLADAADSRKAFGFFTFVAGTDVLGTRLALDGYQAATAVLLIVAGVAWLLLSYGLPLGLITRQGTQSALSGVNGTGFLWTVGTQSIAVAVTTLLPGPVALLTSVAVALWAVGVVLYLLIAGLVLGGMFQSPVDAAGLTPAYWVFMGATAISVLAGGQLLRAPAIPLVAAVRPVVAGLSVVLWAFGTWLIPLLLGFGVWRHLLRGVRLRYEPPLWSMVFPLGMYCVASHALGTALHVPWLTALGTEGAWVAFAVWAAVFTAMIASFAGLPRQPSR